MTATASVPGLYSSSTWRACPTPVPVVRRNRPARQRPPAEPSAPQASVLLAVAVMEVVFGRRSVLALTERVDEVLLDEIARIQYGKRWRGGHVRGVRTQQPTPTSVEAVVSFSFDSRRLAAAIRLDHHDGHWRVTALTLAN